MDCFDTIVWAILMAVLAALGFGLHFLIDLIGSWWTHKTS